MSGVQGPASENDLRASPVTDHPSNARALTPGADRRRDAPLTVLALIVAAAVVLRFWNLGSAGISHGDAGVRLLETVSLATFDALSVPSGAADTLAIAAVALLGVATVVALFLAGRGWVGDSAALAGAAALAGMQLHLIFSRQALSDVLFGLLVLLVIWAVSAAIPRQSLLIGTLAGLAAFLESGREWLPEPSLYAIPRTAALVGRSLWEWTSPFVLALAALGTFVMARRRARGDLLLLAWMVLFLLALPFHRFHPRGLVPLMLPISLASGVGLEALARAIAPAWKRGSVVLVTLALLALGAWSSRSVLALEDRGYELAGRFLAQGPGDSRPDILVAQDAIEFYLREDAHPFVRYGEPGAEDAMRSGGFRYLVGDLRLHEVPRFREYLASRKDDLKLVAEIGNPLPPTSIVDCAGFEGLDALHSDETSPEDRATLDRIRVWRMRRSSGR